MVKFNSEWSEFFTSLTYLTGVIIIAGGAGIWLPWAIGKDLSIDALVTYVFAVLAPVALDLILEIDLLKKSFSKLGRVAFFVSCIVAVAAAFVALVRGEKVQEWAWEFGWFAVILSLIIWAACAQSTERFRPEPSKSAPIGGENATVDGLAGNGLPGA